MDSGSSFVFHLTVPLNSVPHPSLSSFSRSIALWLCWLFSSISPRGGLSIVYKLEWGIIGTPTRLILTDTETIWGIWSGEEDLEETARQRRAEGNKSAAFLSVMSEHGSVGSALKETLNFSLFGKTAVMNSAKFWGNFPSLPLFLFRFFLCVCLLYFRRPQAPVCYPGSHA